MDGRHVRYSDAHLNRALPSPCGLCCRVHRPRARMARAPLPVGATETSRCSPATPAPLGIGGALIRESGHGGGRSYPRLARVSRREGQHLTQQGQCRVRRRRTRDPHGQGLVLPADSDGGAADGSMGAGGFSGQGMPQQGIQASATTCPAGEGRRNAVPGTSAARRHGGLPVPSAPPLVPRL